MAATAEKINRVEQYESWGSFDPAATVYAFRHDLDNYGRILPETMQQGYDEEMTYVAEGIDRHSHTIFVIREDEEQGLVYFAKGKWQPYIGMLVKGLKTAQQEAQEDPRREFLVDDAAHDLGIGYRMQTLKPGESFSYHSRFRIEKLLEHGAEFMTEIGCQVERRMGFIYRVEKLEDGSVKLESHTVDNSNDDAFEAVSNCESGATISDLVQAYDEVLFQQTGQIHRAGRYNSEGAIEENAWDFVQRNKPLFDYYFSEIEKLASSDLWGTELRQAKLRLTYGVWARTKELLNVKKSDPLSGVTMEPSAIQMALDQYQIALDVQRAYTRAATKGDVMVGCGGSIKGEPFEGMTPEQVFESIFGSESVTETLSQTDRYGSLTFECPKGHKNTRRRDELIECCQKCGVSVRC